MDDRELLHAVATRDREAFGELFRRFAPRIKGFLCQSLPAGKAEEVTQEVLLRVWRKAPSYDAARAAPSTWVFAIARNARIDALRRFGRAEPDPEDPVWVPSGVDAPDVATQRRADSERLQKALATLPDGQREVLERAYLKGQSLPEVAAEMGVPLGTVKSRVRLALQRLRGQIPAG